MIIMRGRDGVLLPNSYEPIKSAIIKQAKDWASKRSKELGFEGVVCVVLE